MTEEEILLASLPPRMTKQLRLSGWVFLVFGLFLFVFSLVELLNPSAEIIVNGVATTDIGPKAAATLLSALFVILGAILVLTPMAKLSNLVAWILKRVMEAPTTKLIIRWKAKQRAKGIK